MAKDNKKQRLGGSDEEVTPAGGLGEKEGSTVRLADFVPGDLKISSVKTKILEDFISIYEKTEGDIIPVINNAVRSAKQNGFSPCEVIGYVSGEKGSYRNHVFQMLFYIMQQCDSSSLFAYIDLNNTSKVNDFCAELENVHFNLDESQVLFLFVDKVTSIDWPCYQKIIATITDDNYRGPQVAFILGVDKLPSVLAKCKLPDAQIAHYDIRIANDPCYDNYRYQLAELNIINSHCKPVNSSEEIAEFLKSQKCAASPALVKKMLENKISEANPNEFWNSLEKGGGNLYSVLGAEPPKDIEEEQAYRKIINGVVCNSHGNFLRAKKFVEELKRLDVNDFYGCARKRSANDIYELNLKINVKDSYNTIESIFQDEADFFTVQLLKEDKTAIEKIKKIISNDYFCKTVQPAGQNHLLYLLGMLNQQTDGGDREMLLKLKKTCENEYLYCDPNSDTKKRYGFMLRTISLTYMCWNDAEQSKEFYKRLLKDPVLRYVNNSFHLWYYNDENDSFKNEKIYDVDMQKEYVDEKVICNTLTGLLNTIDKQSVMKFSDGHMLLQLFTCCTLLQDWVYPINSVTGDSGLKTYVVQVREKIESLITGHNLIFADNTERGDNETWQDRELSDYLIKMVDFCKKTCVGNEVWDPKVVDSYTSFTGCRDVKRRNWLIRGVDSSKCESVTEHMYNAWLMAFLLLPEEYGNGDKTKDVVYNKRDIMTMLLLHDLPKSKTGDLLAYNDTNEDKTKEYDDMMQKIVFSSSFSNVESNLRDCALWNEWRDGKSFNSLVAHDINQIQAVFQYLNYVKNNEIQFESQYSFFSKWIACYGRGAGQLKTPIGFDIAEKLGLFSEPIKKEVERLRKKLDIDNNE